MYSLGCFFTFLYNFFDFFFQTELFCAFILDKNVLFFIQKCIFSPCHAFLFENCCARIAYRHTKHTSVNFEIWVSWHFVLTRVFCFFLPKIQVHSDRYPNFSGLLCHMTRVKKKHHRRITLKIRKRKKVFFEVFLECLDDNLNNTFCPFSRTKMCFFPSKSAFFNMPHFFS